MKWAARLFLAFLILVIIIAPWQALAGSLADWRKTTILQQMLFLKPTLVNWLTLRTPANPYNVYILDWAFNSLRVGTLAGLGQVLVSVSLGYAFARWDFPGKGWLMSLSTLQMVVPGSVLFLPMYIVFYKLGLRGWPGLVLPMWFSGGTAIWTRQFARGMASDVLDAAKVDGCGEWQAFWRVGLPLLRPIVAMTFVGAFSSAWSNILWANVMLKGQDEWTLSQGAMMIIAIAQGQSQTAGKIGMMCAMGIVCTLPVICLYAIAQTQVETGLEELFRE